MQASLTLISRNVKTGPIPVSMTSADSCPSNCPLSGRNGCYAESGNTAIHWRNVTIKKTGMVWAEFCKAVAKLSKGTLWRHNVAGDLPGDKRHIDARRLRQLIAANRGKRGFTYTHYDPQCGENAELIAEAINKGFTVNLSADSLEGADRLLALKIAPVVTLLPSSVSGNAKLATPQGARVVVCPATYKDKVTCATCKLCAIASRKTVIGFPAHGTSKRKADLITSKGA